MFDKKLNKKINQMKTLVRITTAVLLTLSFTSCINAQFGKRVRGNGEAITKTRNISEYNKISVAGPFDVKLISGKEGKITIKAESNLLEYIITEVEGGKLKIKWEKGISVRNSKKILVTVPFEDLNAVSLAGSGDIFSEDLIQAKTFKTSLTGTGDIRLAINAHEVISKISGSGNIDLEGKTDQHTCSVTGSGDIESYKLKATDADVRITGSGSIEVDVSDNLKVRITGSGDVYYSGSPKQQDVKVTGSGDVSSR